MLTTRSRSLAAIAAAALTLTALAGCGSGDKTKNADARTTTSATESASAGADVSGDTAAAAPGERLTKDNLVATMLAAMRDKKTAHMSMEIGSSVSAAADVRYSSSGTEMKMSMDMGPTKAVVILVGGEVYMQQSAGAKFVKITKDTPGVGQLVDQMSGLSPDSSIGAWKGAIQQVQYVGTDTVGGAKVDRYRVTLDTSAMTSPLGAAAGFGDLQKSLPKTVTYDLYVDGQHLMRRIDLTISGQKITMLVDHWGDPVDIKAPPASQVMSQ